MNIKPPKKQTKTKKPPTKNPLQKTKTKQKTETPQTVIAHKK